MAMPFTCHGVAGTRNLLFCSPPLSGCRCTCLMRHHSRGSELSTRISCHDLILLLYTPDSRDSRGSTVWSSRKLVKALQSVGENFGMLYMRSLAPSCSSVQGTPEAPRCGFSRKVVDALQSVGESFGTFDILADEAVRQGIKKVSNWPTFPQVYVR